MSDTKRGIINRANNHTKEEVESDTDNENVSQTSFNNDSNQNQINKNNNTKSNTNSKNYNFAFNQSKQNFAKFSQMAKKNNNESLSEQSLSKGEFSNEEENQNSEEQDITNMNNNQQIKSPNSGNRKNITEEKGKKNQNLDVDKDHNDSNDSKRAKNNDESDKSDASFDQIESYNKNLFNLNSQIETQKLTFFNVDEFLDLNLDQDSKSLINIMKRFQPNKELLTLDTKIKPFIPSYMPSIGEVDAFIKINRPDNIIEDLGLGYIDEPTINGVDPSVFALELSYKMKTKKQDNFVIKSIENADKNPKMIQAWVDNLETLHKETSNNFFSYSKKMPEIENLMQVIKNLN